MLSTRKYLGSSMALSLLFHLLLFTVADKLPAFQSQSVKSVKIKKKRTPRLSSIKISELKTIKKTPRFNLNLKKKSSLLSASLKANLTKTPQSVIKPSSSKLLGESKIKSPAKDSSPKTLPQSFYHIDIKSPVKTSNTLTAPNTSSPQISIKLPTQRGNIKLQNTTHTCFKIFSFIF